MSKEVTKDSRFKSRYADAFVRVDQYLAEIAVERLAKKRGLVLPQKFWNTSIWKRQFLMQLHFAQGLLKLYSPSAISRALQTKEGRNVYSLNARWFDELVKIEQENFDRERETIAKTDTEELLSDIDTSNKTVRKPFCSKKSDVGKLE